MEAKSLVRTSLLAALVFVSMALLNFSLFGSSLHLGSLVIVVISLIFPRKESAIASAMGPTIFDLLFGFTIYAPFTLISRLSLSLIVSYTKDKSILKQTLAALVGGIVVIVVYFISYLILLPSKTEALYATIPDIIQLALTVLGVYVAIPIKQAMTTLNKQ